jgi:siroheme synthase
VAEPLSRAGRVTLIGAGPGDAELITLKGARLLGQADTVVYDNLVGQDILNMARPGAERVFVGKTAGHHILPQEEICRLLVDKAREGKFVARLKGGDPLVFGRGGEEIEALLAAGVAVEIVPGVTAALGAQARGKAWDWACRWSSAFAPGKAGRSRSPVGWRAEAVSGCPWLRGTFDDFFTCF